MESYHRVSTKFTQREILERVSRLECKVDLWSSRRALLIDGFNSIDTGIDYKHPSLGGGFGQGFLVAGGYDFVGDAFTGKKNMFSHLFRQP